MIACLNDAPFLLEVDGLRYVKLCNSKKSVTRAGYVLSAANTNAPEYADARAIVQNWRSSHLFPLEVIRSTLESRARRVSAGANVVQRLKRLRSVERKLQRISGFQLAGIQDMGGCRAILKSMDQVDELTEVYRAARLKDPDSRPVLVDDKDDYIAKPKASGYRSRHLIMRYQSASPDRQAWNGHKIEIQLRTILQHHWATAVETASTFLGQDLKSGIGDSRWLRFFVLASGVIATLEGCPLPAGTPIEYFDLLKELRRLWDELEVNVFLAKCRVVTELIPELPSESHYFVLKLDSREGFVAVTPYMESETLRALDAYDRTESFFANDPDVNVVLVTANSMAELESGYPNYFADTHEFISTIADELGVEQYHIIH